MSLKHITEPKTNCFAFDQDKKVCNALSELICSCKETCAFYQHKSNIDIEEIEKSVKHYVELK